jgi:hypothetical protein
MSFSDEAAIHIMAALMKDEVKLDHPKERLPTLAQLAFRAAAALDQERTKRLTEPAKSAK